jgi:hypothetical protein
LQFFHVPSFLRVPVPPIPPCCLVISFLTVDKRHEFIAYRRPGSIFCNTWCITCAILFKAGKILMYEAPGNFGPGIGALGSVYSVAVTRRFIRKGAYLSDWKRKISLLKGDTNQWFQNSILPSVHPQ